MDVFEALILALLYPLLLPPLQTHWPTLCRCWRWVGQAALWLLLSLAVLLHATWLHKVTVCPLASLLVSHGFHRDTIKMVLLVLNLVFLAANVLGLHLLKLLFSHLAQLAKTCMWQQQPEQQQQQQQHPELQQHHHQQEEEEQPRFTTSHQHLHTEHRRRKEFRIDVEPSKTRSGVVYGDRLSKLVSPRTAIRCQRAMSMQFY